MNTSQLTHARMQTTKLRMDYQFTPKHLASGRLHMDRGEYAIWRLLDLRQCLANDAALCVREIMTERWNLVRVSESRVEEVIELN